MPFQNSAESFKAKHHLSTLKTPILVGLCALCLVVLFLVFQGLWGAFDSQQITVIKKNESHDTTKDSSEAEPLDKKSLYVHVGGAVIKPGVYQLAEGSRVFDAVEAAGGFSEQADTDMSNLARIIKDGEQILIPTKHLVPTLGENVSTPPMPSKINLNTATSSELETLPGIGEATAQKIILYREQNGSFQSAEDIKKVAGIGDKKYAEIADKICV